MARKTVRKATKTARKPAPKPAAAPRTKASGKTGKTKVASKKKASAKKSVARKSGTKKQAATPAGKSASGKARRSATAAEIGADLVALCNLGRGDEVVGKWYHQRLVSVEGDGMTTTGLKALAGKYAWWDANHEVHALTATGPFVGHSGFAVRFDIAVTPKGGQRMDMSEIAVYTVRDGRIVREEFMYEC